MSKKCFYIYFTKGLTHQTHQTHLPKTPRFPLLQIELVRVGIIANPDNQSTALLWDYEVAARHWDDDRGGSDVDINKDHNLLRNVATVASSCEMSGRILRKCPFLCYSRSFTNNKEEVNISKFLVELEAQLKLEKQNKSK